MTYQDKKMRILTNLILKTFKLHNEGNPNLTDTTVSFPMLDEASQAIDELVKEMVIGWDDDVIPINPASDEDLVIQMGENANNRLRASQRQVIDKGEK